MLRVALSPVPVCPPSPSVPDETGLTSWLAAASSRSESPGRVFNKKVYWTVANDDAALERNSRQADVSDISNSRKIVLKK